MQKQKILVRAPNWIGDQVLAYPFFYFLRKKHPQAWITSICVDWVEDLQFQDCIDEVFVLRGMKNLDFISRFRELSRYGSELHKKGPWDCAYSLPNSFSAAWLLYMSGAKKKTGYSQDWRGFLLNDRKSWKSGVQKHRADAYVDLLEKTDESAHSGSDFWKNLENKKIKNFSPEKSWGEISTGAPPPYPYWVCAPGATAESRRWSVDQFALLAKLIKKNTGLTGLLVGGAKEAPLSEYLCGDPVLDIKDFTARGPVTSMWKIFQNAQFTVCNESGLAHFASLCGSRVQIICGAADPKRTRPIGPGEVFIKVNPVECWPCERNICMYEDQRKIQCLRGIKPEDVWESLQQWL